jgi:hypothetical protein
MVINFDVSSYVYGVFNMFPNNICAHKPFPTIYTFLQFTLILLSPFKKVKQKHYCIYIIKSYDTILNVKRKAVPQHIYGVAGGEDV